MSKDIERLRKQTVETLMAATATEKKNSALAPSSRKDKAEEAVPSTIPSMQKLPHGWYYFGTSLPPEAASWCRDIDVRAGATASAPTTKPPPHQRPAPRFAKDDIGTAQGWEPMPPATFEAFVPVGPSAVFAGTKEHQAQEPDGFVETLVPPNAIASSREASQDGHVDSKEDLPPKQRRSGEAWCSETGKSQHQLAFDLNPGSVEHLP
mmetsp:Transcript_111760/g.197984  ORF Transcript_111760/g.197984 Transcript_111760/m.197984 type:complete len:208 (+) Transcript_111760:48-671(+)